MKDKIQESLKKAMLAHDDFAKVVLQGLKSAILYEEVAKGKRQEGLSDDEVLAVIAREVKRRDDSVEIYTAAGDKARAEKEMAEREILSKYLPEPLSEDDLRAIVERVINTGGFTVKDMGRVIGDVKAEVGARADGAKIAKLVKEMLN